MLLSSLHCTALLLTVTGRTSAKKIQYMTVAKLDGTHRSRIVWSSRCQSIDYNCSRWRRNSQIWKPWYILHGGNPSADCASELPGVWMKAILTTILNCASDNAASYCYSNDSGTGSMYLMVLNPETGDKKSLRCNAIKGFIVDPQGNGTPPHVLTRLWRTIQHR